MASYTIEIQWKISLDPMRQHKAAQQILAELKEVSVPENRAGMARFGIDVSKALGVSMPNIRQIAQTTVRDHTLALALWQTDIHEARILACLVDEPAKVTRAQMDKWVADFQSWDVCDQVCGNLFDRLPMAEAALQDWCKDEREFVRRAGFAMIAWRAVHLKKEPDTTYLDYFPLIRAGAGDNRNFVRKAVNWALRQIGKRNAELYHPALDLARELATHECASAKWIGRTAVREFESPAVRKKLAV